MSQSLTDVLAHCKQTLQGNLGIVRHVRRILNSPNMPRVHSASSIINSIATYNHSEMVGHTGAVGLDWEEAEIGAIGECIERYCCAVYEHRHLIYACKNQLGDAAITMDDFSMYTEKQQMHPQFPFVKWRDDMEIHWSEGHSLITNKTHYIPACLSYIPYIPNPIEGKTNDLLALAVSSGQASHTELNAALLSGICEVIERDAFMIVWSKKLTMPRIDISDDPELNELYQRYFKCDGLEFHLFDMTLDIGIPSILCIAEGKSDRGPYLCVGAASRPNYRDAIIKAWMEASQGIVWAQSLIDSKPDWRPEENYINVKDFEDHVRLFCEPDMKVHTEFLLNTKDVIKPDFDANKLNDDESLAFCIEQVKSQGFDIISVDLTTDDVKDANFIVPKVFIPGTATLYAVHALPSFGCPRFDSVPKKLGIASLPAGKFNCIPHPFP